MSEFHLALERIAMARVVSNQYEDTIRRIRRWYCKQYFVPLHLVDDISDEELIVEYYESKFEEMEPEERQAKIKQLLLTTEEVVEVEKANSDYDNKLLEEMRLEFEAFKAKKGVKSINKKESDHEEFQAKPIKETPKEPEISVSFDDTPEDMSGWD